MSYKFYKTLDPNLYDLNVYYEKDLYEKATNFGELLVNGVEDLTDFILWSKSKVNFNPIELQTQIFENLDKDGMLKFNEIQFRIFWFERFITAMSPVKTKFYDNLASNVKIFKDISDSIGLLRNVEYLPDDSLLAIFDVDFDLTTSNLADQLIPFNYATSIENKIKPNSKFLSAYMSRYVTSTFRHNMYQLSVPYADSKLPHGSNMVVDYFHYDRIYNIAKEELETELSDLFQDLYEIICFYEQYNPQDLTDNFQNKQKGAINFTMEGLEKQTDYLKKEVGFFKNILDSLTILGVQAE